MCSIPPNDRDVRKLNVDAYDQGVGRLLEEAPAPGYFRERFDWEPASPRAAVLDIGCGYNLHTVHLGCRKFGVDLSHKNLLKGALVHPDAAGVCADAERLPFRSDAFDAVVCLATLHHLPDYPASIGEVARVLREGGVVMIGEANSWGLLPLRVAFAPVNFVRKVLGTFPDYEIHAGKIPVRRIERLLGTHGLVVTRIRGERTLVGEFFGIVRRRLPRTLGEGRAWKWVDRADDLLARAVPYWLNTYCFLVARKGAGAATP